MVNDLKWENRVSFLEMIPKSLAKNKESKCKEILQHLVIQWNISQGVLLDLRFCFSPENLGTVKK